MMKRLSTTQLVPGMTVAEDVLTYDRQLILPRGTVLTDKSIMKLDLYGILTISIENTDGSASSSLFPQEQAYL